MEYILGNPAYLWLILAIILFFIEAVTINLVTIWFGAGAFGGMLCALLGVNTAFQIFVFLIISVVLLLFTRPLAVKYIAKTPTNFDRIIGKQFIVMETIDNMKATGLVKADGKVWTSRSADDTIIEQGQTVTVVEISGVKLIVK